MHLRPRLTLTLCGAALWGAAAAAAGDGAPLTLMHRFDLPKTITGQRNTSTKIATPGNPNRSAMRAPTPPPAAHIAGSITKRIPAMVSSTLVPHIAQNGGTIPSFASDSPPINPT